MNDTPRSPQAHYVRCLKCNTILKCTRYDTTCLLDHIRLDHPEIEVVESITKPTNTQPAQDNKKKPSPRKEQTTADLYSGTNDFDSFDNINTGCGARKRFIPVRSKPVTPSCDNILPEESEAPCACHSPQSHKNSAETSPSAEICNKHSTEIPVCASDPSDAKVLYTRKYNTKTSTQSDYKKKLYRTSIQKWRPAEGTIYCPKCGCSKRPLIRTQADRSTTNSCCASVILACWPLCFLPFLCPKNTAEYLHCSNCKNFLGLYDRDKNCVKPNREYIEFVEETTTEEVNVGPEAC